MNDLQKNLHKVMPTLRWVVLFSVAKALKRYFHVNEKESLEAAVEKEEKRAFEEENSGVSGFIRSHKAQLIGGTLVLGAITAGLAKLYADAMIAHHVKAN